LTSLQICWRLYLLAGRLGWKDWLKRLDLYRYLEYAAVLQALGLWPGAFILDVGSSNSLLPIYLATQGYAVLSVDIDDCRLKQQRKRLLRLEGKLFPTGRLHFEHQDARAFTLKNNTFDCVTAISVLEHIPDEGDKEAVREMARVVKPGGLVIITVPYGTKYFQGRPPQTTAATQRVYSESALAERLAKPSLLSEGHRWYFINRGIDFERKVWRRIPIQLHQITGWTAAGLFCAQLFFRNTPFLNGRSSNSIGLSFVKPQPRD
jgi:SAM-dependent methyltransferase